MVRTAGWPSRPGGVETLRFYEREGLLERPYQHPSGYRAYPPGAVDAVLTIKRAQALGFKLAEIRDLLRGARAGRVSERATRKLEEIDASISHLQKTREELARLVEYRCDHLVGCSCGQADCPVRTIPAIANDQPALRLAPGRAEKRAGLLAAGSAVAACAVCCAPLVAAALTYLGVSALVATESAGIGLGAAAVVVSGASLVRRRRRRAAAPSPQP